MKMSRVTERWEDALSLRSDSTRRNYASYFNRFLERTGLTPDELYRMHLESLRSDDPLDADAVASKVKRVMKEMQREGYRPGTARTVYKSVRLFLKSCNLPFELDRYDKPRVVSEGTSMIKPEQIRKLYDTVSAEMRERNRALIMICKDSGLRVSDIVNLDVEDFNGAELLEDKRYGRFKVFIPKGTEKTGDLSHVIIGGEAIRAVEEYLALDGRTAGPIFLSRPEPIIDETAEETARARRWHSKRKVIGYDEPERLKPKTASQMFLRLRENLRNPYKISAHSLRKFHYNTLLLAGMPADYIRFLQGKAYSEYARPIENREEIISRYMEAYEKLAIFEDSAVRRETIEELQRQVSEQQRTIELMMPTFKMAQRMFNGKREWDKLRESRI